MANETGDRIYRSKRMDQVDPGESRVYFPKRFYGERSGAPSSPGGTTEGAARATTEPSISAEEIRANSVSTGTPAASGGAAPTPTTNR